MQLDFVGIRVEAGLLCRGSRIKKIVQEKREIVYRSCPEIVVSLRHDVHGS